MKKIRKKNGAVSEIVGVALLLGLSIALFAVVQIIAMSLPFNTGAPTARLVGNIEGDTIYIVHHGGESLSLDDTRVIFTIDGLAQPIIGNVGEFLNSTTSNGDDLWNIGEKLNFTNLEIKNLPYLQVGIIVVDDETNTIIMRSTIQE